jgi:hypothetical protein
MIIIPEIGEQILVFVGENGQSNAVRVVVERIQAAPNGGFLCVISPAPGEMVWDVNKVGKAAPDSLPPQGIRRLVHITASPPMKRAAKAVGTWDTVTPTKAKL